MPFYVVAFIVAWLTLLVYAVSAVRLGLRVYNLRNKGRFPEAPDLFHPLHRIRAIGWMISGRYAALNDPIVARWARVARTSLLAAIPLVIGSVILMGVSTVSANIDAADAAGDRGQQLIGDGPGR